MLVYSLKCLFAYCLSILYIDFQHFHILFFSKKKMLEHFLHLFFSKKYFKNLAAVYFPKINIGVYFKSFSYFQEQKDVVFIWLSTAFLESVGSIIASEMLKDLLNFCLTFFQQKLMLVNLVHLLMLNSSCWLSMTTFTPHNTL